MSTIQVNFITKNLTTDDICFKLIFGCSCFFWFVYQKGLPPSPPSGPATIEDQLFPSNGNDGMPIKPLGVDVSTRRKDGSDGSKIAIVVLSSVAAFIVCVAFLWIVLLKCGCSQTSRGPLSSSGKPSGSYSQLNLYKNILTE